MKKDSTVTAVGEVKEWLKMAGALAGLAALAVFGGIVLCLWYVSLIAVAIRWYVLAVVIVFWLWKIAERL